MNNINYKYTTFGLLFLLVLIVSWNHETIFNTNNSYAKNTHAMRMTDGSMMEMENGSNMMMKDQDMNSMMTSMVVGLKGKSGAALEKEFIAEMIPHHQGAVDMAKILLADPNLKPALRTFAEGIISAQEGEIKQMNIWLQNYKN